MAFAEQATPQRGPLGTQVAVAGPLLKRILQTIADPAKNPQGRLLESKIRDYKGNLQPVYRGLTEPPTAHGQGRFRAQYFTDEPEIAHTYAAGASLPTGMSKEPQGNVLPAFLDIKNPYAVDFTGGHISDDLDSFDWQDISKIVENDVDPFKRIPDEFDGIVMALEDAGKKTAVDDYESLIRSRNEAEEFGYTHELGAIEDILEEVESDAVRYPQIQYIPKSREQIVSPFEIMKWGLE